MNFSMKNISKIGMDGLIFEIRILKLGENPSEIKDGRHSSFWSGYNDSSKNELRYCLTITKQGVILERHLFSNRRKAGVWAENYIMEVPNKGTEAQKPLFPDEHYIINNNIKRCT